MKISTLPRYLLTLCLIIFAKHVFSQTIATCGKTEGFALYHYQGLIKKSDSGFKKDEIPSGLVTLQKKANGNFDILLVDSRKKIISLAQDGGEIVLLRKGSRDATFMHYHVGMVIELYTFWLDNDDKPHYDIVQSKGGNGMPVHKSAVLSGQCDSIDFRLLE